jgi:hypothetical protein
VQFEPHAAVFDNPEEPAPASPTLEAFIEEVLDSSLPLRATYRGAALRTALSDHR